MRLSQQQITAIKELTEETFGDDAEVYLFGSRVDDTRRGGDIDLYVETDLDDPEQIVEARLRFLSRLKQRIGDQRIDVVLRYPSRQPPPPIWETAKRTGIRL